MSQSPPRKRDDATTPKVIEMTNEAFEYLSALDKRLHFATEVEYCGMMRSYDDYHDQEKLTEMQLHRLLSFCTSDNLILRPINTNMGFSVGFEVIHFEIEELLAYCPPPLPRLRSLLKFLEKQLPEGYNFDTLTKWFNSERNKALLKQAGLQEPQSYGYYEY